MNIIQKTMKKGWDVKDISRVTGLRPDIVLALNNGTIEEVSEGMREIEEALKGKRKEKMAKFSHPIVLAPSISKGGVGKTSTLINLAATLADMGYFCLVIDTDGQTDSTYSLLGPTFVPNHDTVSDMLMKGEDARRFIKPTIAHPLIDIIPSDVRMQDVEDMTHNDKDRLHRLENCLSGVIKESLYDFILFDCGNRLNSFSDMIWMCSNPIYIYTLMDVDPYATKELPKIKQRVDSMVKKNPGIHHIGMLFNRVKESSYVYKEIFGVIREMDQSILPGNLFHSYIHVDENINKAHLEMKPLIQYRRKSKAAIDYQNVALEMIERVEVIENGKEK